MLQKYRARTRGAPLSLLALFLAFIPAAAKAADPIVIRFSHVAAPQAHKTKATHRFKELAETYTGGRVRIELFPGSQLYKDKEELEALQLGAVEMLAPSLSKFGPLGIRAFETFDIPYIFKSYEELAAVTEGPIGKELLGLLETKGIKGLAFWNNGFKILSANRPLIAPDDVLGLKMRIQSSRVIEEQMLAMGGLPQVLPFSEAYQALSSGVVDGTENPPSNLYNKKMYDVQKHATLTWHGYLGYAVIANKDFWDGLPPDIRAALERAIEETTPYANAEAKKENDEALAEMLKSPVISFHKPTEAERAAWIAALSSVEKRMAGRVGKDLIDRFRKATANVPTTTVTRPGP